jgi:hypothetical protein
MGARTVSCEKNSWPMTFNIAAQHNPEIRLDIALIRTRFRASPSVAIDTADSSRKDPAADATATMAISDAKIP